MGAGIVRVAAGHVLHGQSDRRRQLLARDGRHRLRDPFSGRAVGVAAAARFSCWPRGVLLAVVLFSVDDSSPVRVFLVKHFYRHKYDYREEWLRLTASLGRSGDLRQLTSSALAGIARIVGSQLGSLWLAQGRPAVRAHAVARRRGNRRTRCTGPESDRAVPRGARLGHRQRRVRSRARSLWHGVRGARATRLCRQARLSCPWIVRDRCKAS